MRCIVGPTAVTAMMVVGVPATVQIDFVSAAPVQFTIGATTLAIPRNYFYHDPHVALRWGDDGKIYRSSDPQEIEFAMRLKLPDLHPPAISGEVTFETQGIQEIISVDIANKSHFLTGRANFDAFYQHRKSDISNSSFGFKFSL